jgi:hypothetical protein
MPCELQEYDREKADDQHGGEHCQEPALWTQAWRLSLPSGSLLRARAMLGRTIDVCGHEQPAFIFGLRCGPWDRQDTGCHPARIG